MLFIGIYKKQSSYIIKEFVTAEKSRQKSQKKFHSPW